MQSIHALIQQYQDVLTCVYHDFVTQPWPLKGGKWGQEVPHTSTDVILTG